MYTLFQCADTKALCHEAVAAGFAAWVPLLKYTRKCPKTGKTTETTVAAIAGYIFIPYPQWTNFARWGVERGKRIRLCTKGEDEFRAPVKITLAELQTLEKACQRLGKTPAASPAKMRTNDRVRITYGPMTGWEGTVTEVRRTSLRVQVGTQYVGIPTVFVEKV